MKKNPSNSPAGSVDLRKPTNGSSPPAKAGAQAHVQAEETSGVVRVLVIDENRLLRDTVSSMVKNSRGMELVQALENLPENPVQASAGKAHVVLANFGNRNGDAPERVRACGNLYPDGRIIVMRVSPDRQDIVHLMKAGAAGFILEDASGEDIVAAIHMVARGGNVLPVELNGSLFAQIATAPQAAPEPKPVLNKDVRMTNREREVIDLITEGLSNKEIAGRLSIATYTIKSHVHNIMEKLNLHSRLQIANLAKAETKK